MSWLEAIIFGVVEGFTEFLPISSTGHLTILESAFGHATDDPDITAFTAIIQVGAVAATLIYLRHDIVKISAAFWRGLAHPDHRHDADYRFAWAVIVGSLPIMVVGFVFKDSIENDLRSLWVVGAALIAWSAVLWYADNHASLRRHEEDVGWRDTLFIGTAQCLALIPGISRAGATFSAGLLRGIDRVEVVRLSFFLSIPALTAAGIYQTVDEFENISNGVGWGPTIIATVASFAVALWAINWLLHYVARHSYSIFVIYRVALGALVLSLVGSGVLSAT